MEIKAVDGKLSVTSLFWPVAVGYGIGAGVFLVPMFLLVGLLMSFVPAGVDQNGQSLDPAMMVVPMVIMVPFIVAMLGQWQTVRHHRR